MGSSSPHRDCFGMLQLHSVYRLTAVETTSSLFGCLTEATFERANGAASERFGRLLNRFAGSRRGPTTLGSAPNGGHVRASCRLCTSKPRGGPVRSTNRLTWLAKRFPNSGVHTMCSTRCVGPGRENHDRRWRHAASVLRNPWTAVALWRRIPSACPELGCGPCSLTIACMAFSTSSRRWQAGFDDRRGPPDPRSPPYDAPLDPSIGAARCSRGSCVSSADSATTRRDPLERTRWAGRGLVLYGRLAGRGIGRRIWSRSRWWRTLLGLDEYGRLALVMSFVVPCRTVLRCTCGDGGNDFRRSPDRVEGLGWVQRPFSASDTGIDAITGVFGFAIVVVAAPFVGPWLVGDEGTQTRAPVRAHAPRINTRQLVRNCSAPHGTVSASRHLQDGARDVSDWSYRVGARHLSRSCLRSGRARRVRLRRRGGELVRCQSRIFSRFGPLLIGKIPSQFTERRAMLRMVFHTNVVSYARIAQVQLPTLFLGALTTTTQAGSSTRSERPPAR